MVANDEVIPMVRRRIADAGLTDVEVIHLGADKVFVRSKQGLDVAPMLESAREFFNLIFTHWAGWEDKTTPFHRGAWVRLYGIPLQAWNKSFFKLCVLDCGKFLRADNYTKEKDMLDFARVLIATSSLEVIKRVERLLVDDTVVDVQVVEEWGYDMGDDACILIDDEAVEAPPSDNKEDWCDPEVSQHVDKMVEDLADGVAREAGSTFHHVGVGNSKSFVESPDCLGLVLQPIRVPSGATTGSRVARVAETQDPGGPAGGGFPRVAKEAVRQRARSCLPKGRRPALSGQWSSCSLQNNTHGDAGELCSSKKKALKPVCWFACLTDVF
jgi:hypothetical protein